MSVDGTHHYGVQIDLAALPNEPDVLQQMLREVVPEPYAENHKLWLLIQRRLRHRYGPRSEKLNLDQLQLVLVDAEQSAAEAGAATDAAAPPVRRRRAVPAHRNRGALPAHLPRYELVIDIETKDCPCCGGTLHVIGEDRSEHLDLVPAQLRGRSANECRYASGCSLPQLPSPVSAPVCRPNRSVPWALPSSAMGLAYVALGTLIVAYSLPGFAVALPGSWLIARMGDRRMVLASLALMVIGGGLMAIGQNYQILLARRVLTGTGAAMLSVVVPKIVFDQVPPARLAALMGGVLAGYPLGFALALLSLPLLGSWRLAMGLCALVRAVVFVAASAITTRSAESGATSVWALYNGGCLILFSFVPAFFVAHGMSLALAGAMTSLCLYTMIPVAPFGGWLFARSVGVIPGILLSLARMAALPVLLLTNIPPAALMIAFGAIVGLRLAAVRSSRSQARVCSPRSGHWRGEACSRYSTLRWPRPHRWPVLRATSP